MRHSALAIRIVAVILGVLGIRALVIIPARCNRTIPRVERLTHRALEEASQITAARIAQDNLARLRAVAPGCRNDVNLHLLMAFNANILGRRDEALGHLSDALKVDDRPEIYFNRGLILLEAGRVDEAVEEFATSSAFNVTILDQLDPEIRRRVDAIIRNRPRARAPFDQRR